MHNMFNYQIIQDAEIKALMDAFPFSDVTWNESSLTSEVKYTNPSLANTILSVAHAMIAVKYLSQYKATLTYARPWQGKTLDGENCDYHNDKLCEIDEFVDKPNRIVSNYLALYYHSDLKAAGVSGLEFWNKLTDDREIIRPQSGDLLLINERDGNDHIWHRVVKFDNPNLKRYVVGFGFVTE